MKDDFISTVTHELRTPLTSIRAFSEILHENPDLDVKRRVHFLDIILKESERLTLLINQVFDLAKLEDGAVEWTTTDVEMRVPVDESIVAAIPMVQGKGVAIHAQVDGDVPPIWVDRDRIMQGLPINAQTVSHFGASL